LEELLFKMKAYALFIHQGRHEKDIVDTLLIPVGVIALADFLTKKGFKSLILNNSLNILNGKENIEKIIDDLNPEFLCISLHWHFQIRDTIELVRKLKREYPSKKIILGGFTASYFAKEIMKEIPEIDFIIKGDAEIPLLKLFLHYKGKGKLSNIPNLFYRSKGKIIENQKKFIAYRKILNSLNYFNYNLIINKKDALQGNWRCIIKKEEKIWDDDTTLKPRVYYTLARGCIYNCSFCGGSRIAQMKINNRKAIISKSYESVIRDIKGFLKLGIKNIYFGGLLSDSKYFSGLFSEFRKQKISFQITFEGCGLPSEKFLKEFSITFKKHLKKSRLIFFPESGSELIRKFNKGIFFTNSQIFKSLDIAKKLGIIIEVRFILGLPMKRQKPLWKH